MWNSAITCSQIKSLRSQHTSVLNVDLIMTLTEMLDNMEGRSNSSDKLISLDDDAVRRLRESVEVAGGLPITLDCRDKILAVSHVDINEVILPLCAWLEGLVKDYVKTEGGGGRLLIGIVGPAAAGKSTLSQLLCAACTTLLGASLVQCVSMDGYSFPNSYLRAEQAIDHQGRPCTLKDIKGLPNTLDVDALLRDLLRLRTAGREPVLLPSYNRDLHDPVPDSVAIATDCKVVIIEGLHLLHREGLWEDVSDTFYRTIFLDIERSCCFQRVVGRKVANGRSRESSEAHFDRVDGPTFDQLQEEKNNANLILALRPTLERPLNVVDVRVQVSPITQREVTKPK